MKNICFIHCDSMDGRVMGCAGHPAAHTPNLDRLAARGIRFTNAYTPSTVCVPSRAATWTGRYSHRLRVWNNGGGLESDEHTFLPRLNEAGYTTTTIGRDDRFQDQHSMGNRLMAWTRSSGVCLLRGSPPMAKLLQDKKERVRDDDWPHTENALEWLARRRPGDKPFFLSLGYLNPHPMAGYTTSPFYRDMIKRDRISPPPPCEENHPAMHFMQRAKRCDEPVDTETLCDIRHHYYAMIAEVDHQVGLVLDQLESSGLADSTLVVFFSDHGDMQMEHGQWRKSCMYEASVRVPLIMAGPGMTGGQVREDLVSLLDLYPTLLEWAGTPADPGADGVSLFRPQEERPDFVVSQYHDCMQPTGSFMTRWYRPELNSLRMTFPLA